jgi:hypothetical protein
MGRAGRGRACTKFVRLASFSSADGVVGLALGGITMNELSDWIQANWFELGSLALQIATLASLVWFGRKAMAQLARGQSVRHAEAPATEPMAMEAATPDTTHPFHGGLRGLIPMEAPTARGPERTKAISAVPAEMGLWRSIVKWLNAPMNDDATVPWRRIRQIS